VTVTRFIGNADLTPAACIDQLPEPGLEIDEDDNPLNDLQSIELRRSVLTIAELDHASEMALVEEIVAARRKREAGR
jgi:hypothetical protein